MFSAAGGAVRVAVVKTNEEGLDTSAVSTCGSRCGDFGAWPASLPLSRFVSRMKMKFQCQMSRADAKVDLAQDRM